MKKFIFLFTLFFISLPGLYCQTNAPAIDSLKVQQLAGLCRVWGFLKYYHPTIQKGIIDWDSTLVHYIPKILKVSNNEEYNKTINEFILLPGKVKKLNRPYKYLPKDTSYNNFDYAWISNEKLFSKENSKLLFEVIENYKPNKNIYITKEINAEDLRYYQQYRRNYSYFPDMPNSLLTMFRYWNSINYFFAYKKIMDENWNDILNEFIPKIISASGKIDFYLVMAEMIAKTNDCHGFFDNGDFNAFFGSNLPIIVKLMENKTVITSIDADLSASTHLKVGDIILKINGTSIEEKRQSWKKYCNCSHPTSVDREIDMNLLRFPYYSSVTIISLNQYQKTDTTTFDRNFFYSSPNEKKTLKWKNPIENTAYIDLSQCTMRDVRHFMNQNRKMEGLIFDCRNNISPPLLGIGLRLKRIKNHPANCAIWYIGKYKYPGTFKRSYAKDYLYGLRTFHRKFKGQAVFLINEKNQSMDEDMLMQLKSGYAVTFVGNVTSGTDGEVRSLKLQKNFIVYFTGDAVFFSNGQYFQRKGLVPDIPVALSIKGIQQGKDEILERALEYIKTGK